VIFALFGVIVVQSAVIAYMVFVARDLLSRWGEFLMARSLPELVAAERARAGDEEPELPRRKPNRWLG
jgi:hypothetical protein